MDKTLRQSSRIIIILITIALIISLAAGFGIFYKRTHADNSAPAYRPEYASTKRDTKFTFNSDGTMQIERNRVKDQTKGDDSWTFLVYMCGTDIESAKGLVSQTLENIRSCNINSENAKNLNVIIQTGGTSKWNGSYSWIDTSKIERHILSENGKYSTVDTRLKTSMGDPKTLNEFIEWGLTNYPAERTAIAFYNHGSTTTNGICFDELYNYDSLSLNELEYAFAASKDVMKDTFDLAIFDTCLTGTIEYANALAPYVDYMFASAQSIPTGSFRYKEFLDSILDDPSISSVKALDILNESFVERCNSMNLSPEIKEQTCVQSIDLTKIDDLIIEFNYAFKQLFDKAYTSKKDYKSIFKGLYNVASYTDTQLDIGNLIYCIDEYDTASFQKSMDKVRVCWTDGYDTTNTANISQLSFYFNFEPTIYTYDQVRNVYTSPYLLKLLELTGHMAAKRDFDNYNEFNWESSPFFYEDNFDFLNYRYYNNSKECIERLTNKSDYSSAGFLENWIVYLDNMQLNDRTPSRHIETEIDGTAISHVVNGESRDSVYEIYNSVFTTLDDVTVCLGETNTATYDKKTGEITTNFKGDWIMLGDGQVLTCYVGKTTKDYTEYFIPVSIDAVESSIIVHLGKKNKFEIIGVLDSTPHSKHIGRINPLEKGTVISPIYDVWDETTETYFSEYGENYVIKGSNDFLFTTLKNGDNYQYNSIVKNYYGQTLYSDIKKFSMTDGKIFFSKDTVE